MAAKSAKATRMFIPFESQKSLLSLVQSIMQEHKKYSDYKSKMEAIDIAYARYQATKDANGNTAMNGVDAATTPVGVLNLPSTTPPVVVAQVDSMVGYLADVFFSGTPLFPVVSTPTTRNDAETLESIIDDHATLGGYARQGLMFLRDGVKYNLSALEVEWTSIDQYVIEPSIDQADGQKLSKAGVYYNKLSRLDPYNLVWDHTVAPGDVALKGDYAGYVEILSRTKLKRLLNKLSTEGVVLNAGRAAKSVMSDKVGDSSVYYNVHPKVSEYINPVKPLDGINYYEYITGKKDPRILGNDSNAELVTLYVRIQPSDYGLLSTETNTPQIWKIRVINDSIIIQATRVLSAYDMLPILFGQPLEDGLGYQTQSVAEGAIPFQTAAATMFNIRFNSARRAVSDRALYDPTLISPSDVNAPVPAAKIPVKTNSLTPLKKISDAYHPIPFDPKGTETSLQDGMTIANFSKELQGLNNPMRGQFQKGNKSVQEWNDTMSGADSRARLPALVLEYQVFMPLKEALKLNIFQYGQSGGTTISQRSGKQYEVDIAKLRKTVLAFRVADGFTPKSKLASTDSLIQVMQMLMNSNVLMMQFGGLLPGMFLHIAQLLGIRGIEEYGITAQQAMQNMQQTQQQMQGPDMAKIIQSLLPALVNANSQQPSNTPPQG